MKGFVISWFFPPINSSEGLVTFKLLKYSKYKHDVFTQNNNDSWSYKNTEAQLQNSKIHVIQSKNKVFKDWEKEGLEYFQRSYHNYSFIMSRSMPPESHELALAIKDKFPKIPWIASFGDPIADNPYTIISQKSLSPFISRKLNYLNPVRLVKHLLWLNNNVLPNKKQNKKLKDLEYSILTKADVVIFNNKYEREYMLKNHNIEVSEKYIILPHTFDEELYPESQKKDKKMIFSYLGYLDDQRSPQIFFQAIRKLLDQDPKLANRVSFDFYGNMSSNDKVFIIDNYLTDIIHVKKTVDYIESLEIMRKSDWLLLVDAPIYSVYQTSIFFPGKLADYIGSKTPTLGITMLEGESADILRETGGLALSFSKSDIYNYLYLIIYKGYKIKPGINIKKYDSKLVTKTYDKIINEFDNV